MKKIGLFLLLGFSLSWLVSACQERQQERRKEVPLDSIVLSDPCILADRKTAMYYMTGTGGMLWKSKDLKLWEGPFHVAKTDSGSWMGTLFGLPLKVRAMMLAEVEKKNLGE